MSEQSPAQNLEQLKNQIVDVPNFPKEGIIFKDITPILMNPESFSAMIDHFALSVKDTKINKIAAIESRGFLIGAPLAERLKCGLVLVRKKGKLPRETVSAKFGLEYGNDEIEIQKNDIAAGEKVLIVDDVLATGGTAAAAESLCHSLGANVIGFRFLIGLKFLEGHQKLEASHLSLIEF